MPRATLMIAFLFFIFSTGAQTPKTFTSSEILLQLKKLKTLGSVLYVAAHPDDENTRLLSYLANEKLYRTGYLSLTRGDGGQNLIGDEQGIDLGLIRTQELLAARRNDGAEQFFTRAYDFGYSKSPEEALRIWGHDKILSDVVWVIRKFRPDVIITRFPTTGEGGHGHHTASALLAIEACDAAGDETKFPEHFKHGVTTWKAKRVLWNSFNFGGNSADREGQLKVDVGGYNAILGKSYGEIAAASRSQHKSQGFGVPAQRGEIFEFFATLKGEKIQADIMEGIDVTWKRANLEAADEQLSSIINRYDVQHPEKSFTAVVKLYRLIEASKADDYWKKWKLEELRSLIENCSGLFMEATTEKQLNVTGDSVRVNFTINNRSGIIIPSIEVVAGNINYTLASPKKNENNSQQFSLLLHNLKSSQPYWLAKGAVNGSFEVDDQQLIGKPDDQQAFVIFRLKPDNGSPIEFKKPLRFKSTDPVKGETYQPVQFIDPVLVNVSHNLVIFKNTDHSSRDVNLNLHANTAVSGKAKFIAINNGTNVVIFDSVISLSKGQRLSTRFTLNSSTLATNSKQSFSASLTSPVLVDTQRYSLRKISYEHIPEIQYRYIDQVTVLKLDLKIAGREVGYIAGAGDKVPQALEQMGYKVTMLTEMDIRNSNLDHFDAIVTGIRAYNVHEWLSSTYDILMQYVKDGGVLLTQYNTNSSIGPVKAKIGPYPFSISRNRVTDENAKVNFLLPGHPSLNFPNKINDSDFEGWVQERSIYHAETSDANFKKIISMKDPGENENDGSLIIADYGKGRFIYTGLVFFRELPAAVPGAYRLFANLIANERSEK